MIVYVGDALVSPADKMTKGRCAPHQPLPVLDYNLCNQRKRITLYSLENQSKTRVEAKKKRQQVQPLFLKQAAVSCLLFGTRLEQATI